MRVSSVHGAWLPLLVGTSFCAPSVSLVPRGPHPVTGVVSPILVDSRPPPVKVQFIQEPPQSNCQWADGEWVWRGNEWRWQEGQWLTPANGAYFADSVFVWLPTRANPNGELYYTHSQWYDRDGSRREGPPPCVAPARL